MKNLNRIPLNALRACESVGRLGTLKDAAEELGVTIGAVSQQVQKGEQQLGMALFTRHARGLTPTPFGEPVLAQLSQGFQTLSRAVSAAQRDRSDSLTVSVAPVFAGRWLVWHLKRFSRAHPGIRVRVEAIVDLVDPDASDVDLCIRVSKGPFPGKNAKKLLDVRVFPVCSPALARELKTIDDLTRVPIIRDQGQLFHWNSWLKPLGLDDSILGDGPSYSDGSLCFDAAVAGQGVFLGWETLATHALTNRQVVMPFARKEKNGYGYWLIGSALRQPTPAVKAFSEWIAQELPSSLGYGSDKTPA